MSAFTSLLPTSEAAATGQARQLARATAHHTLLVTVAADGQAVRDCVVRLQGSHDGINWTPIGVVQSPTGGLASTQPTAHLMTWVRAVLERLDADDGVLVTATIASDDDATAV